MNASSSSTTTSSRTTNQRLWQEEKDAGKVTQAGFFRRRLKNSSEVENPNGGAMWGLWRRILLQKISKKYIFHETTTHFFRWTQPTLGNHFLYVHFFSKPLPLRWISGRRSIAAPKPYNISGEIRGWSRCEGGRNPGWFGKGRAGRCFVWGKPFGLGWMCFWEFCDVFSFFSLSKKSGCDFFLPNKSKCQGPELYEFSSRYTEVNE